MAKLLSIKLLLTEFITARVVSIARQVMYLLPLNFWSDLSPEKFMIGHRPSRPGSGYTTDQQAISSQPFGNKFQSGTIGYRLYFIYELVFYVRTQSCLTSIDSILYGNPLDSSNEVLTTLCNTEICHIFYQGSHVSAGTINAADYTKPWAVELNQENLLQNTVACSYWCLFQI